MFYYHDFWTKRSTDPAPKRIPLAADFLRVALEKHGFKRRIAGDYIFESAVNAVMTADTNKLGLIISGSFGVGKSVLLKALYEMYRDDFKYETIFFNLREPNDVNLMLMSVNQLGLCSVFNKIRWTLPEQQIN